MQAAAKLFHPISGILEHCSSFAYSSSLVYKLNYNSACSDELEESESYLFAKRSQGSKTLVSISCDGLDWAMLPGIGFCVEKARLQQMRCLACSTANRLAMTEV